MYVFHQSISTWWEQKVLLPKQSQEKSFSSCNTSDMQRRKRDFHLHWLVLWNVKRSQKATEEREWLFSFSSRFPCLPPLILSFRRKYFDNVDARQASRYQSGDKVGRLLTSLTREPKKTEKLSSQEMRMRITKQREKRCGDFWILHKQVYTHAHIHTRNTRLTWKIFWKLLKSLSMKTQWIGSDFLKCFLRKLC